MDTPETGVLLWRLGTGRKEAIPHGWRAAVERTESGDWQASIESTLSDERIEAPIRYPSAQAAVDWCVHTLGRRYPIILLAARVAFPNASENIRRSVLQKLRVYDTDTAGRLIVQTIGAWDRRRTSALHARKVYRTLPLGILGGETRYYFWYTIKDADLLASAPRLPPGSRTLAPRQIEREAIAWAHQLTKTPFYETIYTFSLAAIDWLRTCDLRSFEENAEQNALDAALWNFQMFLAVD